MSITKERMEQELILILDTDYIIAGYAGNLTPSCVIPPVVGIPQYSSPESFIGDEALDFNDMLELFYPLSNFYFTDLKKLEKLLSYVLFDELNINPFQTTHPIKCWISPLALEKKDELELIFTESLKINAPVFQSKSLLSLYSINLVSGIVVDFGEHTTVIDVILNDHSTEIQRIKIGRARLLKEIATLFAKKNLSLSRLDQLSFLENMCAFRCDSLNSQQHPQSTSFKLSSGEQVYVGDRRLKICDVLFQSDFIEKLACSATKGQVNIPK
ncbi:MAG: hypothetical protein ACFFBD_02790, partial [Candidatus Hodarchaeota archaeon]